MSQSGNLDHLRRGNGKANRGPQPGRQQLVGQHPHMLRVVAEFDHVEIAVGSEHELALRSAAHASNLLGCHHGHGNRLLRCAAIASSSILAGARESWQLFPPPPRFW